MQDICKKCKKTYIQQILLSMTRWEEVGGMVHSLQTALYSSQICASGAQSQETLANRGHWENQFLLNGGINLKQSHYGSQTSVIHRSERVHLNAHWWKGMWMGALLAEWFQLMYYKNCVLNWGLLDRGVVTVLSLSILTCFNWNILLGKGRWQTLSNPVWYVSACSVKGRHSTSTLLGYFDWDVGHMHLILPYCPKATFTCPSMPWIFYLRLLQQSRATKLLSPTVEPSLLLLNHTVFPAACKSIIKDKWCSFQSFRELLYKIYHKI